ncbi:15603_t:CDS:2 [Rhizophagus irregularis]|nr:15603_t:CDS:2 [Rhizophagus irregularis]
MSSYKADAITQKPVLYLKNAKQELWEKFHEKYPNPNGKNAIQGICGTSVAHLEPERKREINPNRLTIEELKKKLSDYGIDTDIISDNRVVLAEILQNISNDETSKQVSDMLYNETIDTDLDSRQVSEYKLDFLLSSGWALKENQRFGKKGGGKRMSKNVVSYLEAYFLAGDINKSEKIYGSRNAEMHNELKGLVEGGILEKEEIPKIFTISNWIARYLVK